MKHTINLVLFLLVSVGASAQLQINFESIDTMPEQGTPVTVDVTVADFVDIVNLQFWVYWDSTVLEFDTITNLNEDIGMNLDGFNYPGNMIVQNGMPAIYQDGKIGVSWQDALNTQTLDDGDILFSILLNTVGCSTTDMTIGDNPPFAEIEVYQNFDFSPNGNIGAVSDGISFIGCPDSETDCEFTFTLSQEQGVVNEEVCVFLSVENFNDVESFQGGIFFDNSVLEWTDFDFDISADFQGVSNSADGELSFIWVNDNTTLPDGSEVLKLTFDVIGEIGESTTLTLGDASSTVLEVLSSDGFLEVCTEPGSVEVVDVVTNPVELDLMDVSPQNESNVCIPLTVNNFTSVSNMQFALMWDSEIFCYTGVQNLNSDIGIVESGNINPSPQGNRLNISWVSSTGGGITVEGEQILFEACFDVKATCNDLNPIESTIVIVGNPLIEISGEVGGQIVPLPVETSDSDVTIICVDANPCANTEILTATEVTNVGCLGESNGSVIASASGGAVPYSYEFFDASGSVIQVSSTNNSMTGLAAGTYSVSVVDDNDCEGGSTSFTITEPNTSISVTAAATDASCTTGGTITTTVNDAVGNVMYNWSGGLGGADPNNVPAGSYSVVVTDGNGCTASTTVLVGSSNEVMIGAGSFTNFSCDGGGTITPTYTGGSGNYTYNWSDLSGGPGTLANRIGLNPGTYTVTVNDTTTGCTDTRTYTIGTDVVPFMVTEGNTTDIGCDSDTGSYTYSVTGGCQGVGGYICVLDGGAPSACNGTITGLTAGSHTLVISDDIGNNTTLTFTISATISELMILNSGNLSVVDVECNGDQTGFLEGVNITGGCPSALGDYTCMLNGVTVDCADVSTIMLSAGDYDLEVTDSNNNTDTASFSVAEPDAIVITEGIVTEGDLCTNGVTVDVTGGNSAYTYNWTFNGEDFVGEDNLTDLCPGEYCLDVVDGNGCESASTYCVTFMTTITIEGVEITSINDNSGFGVSCFGTCDAVISGTQTSGGALDIELVDQDGNVTVFQSFPLDGVCAGTYTMTATDEFGSMYIHPDNIVVTTPVELTGEVINIIDEVDGNSEGAIEILVDGDVGGYVFDWSETGCDGIACTGLSAGTYSVMVTDANGCDLILPNIEVGNVIDSIPCYEGTAMITPNGDGVNDVFNISCLNDGTLVSYTLGIYDRWGRQVLDTDNYDNQWGGTDTDGSNLLEGGYYWVLVGDFDNGDQRIFKGAVTILRDL